MRPTAGGEADIDATFELAPGERSRDRLQGVVVVYEDRLMSDVRRGENRGVTLQHDRVVRSWMPLALAPGGDPQRLRRTVALQPGWDAAKLGVAAFVEDLRTGEVLQALALPGCMAAVN
jgi:hypothetical protein